MPGQEALERGYSIERSESGLEISQRWFSSADLLSLLGVVLVDIAGVGFAIAAGVSAISVLGLTIAGLATYVAAAKLLNRTVVRVSPAKLERYSRPLPWPGRLELPARDLNDLKTSEVPLKWDFGGMRSYRLVAITSTGPLTLFETRDVDSSNIDELAQTIREMISEGRTPTEPS